MTRRQACFLAAQREIEQARTPRPGAKEKRDMHAADMRARRILEGCSGRKLPSELEAKVQAIVDAAEGAHA